MTGDERFYAFIIAHTSRSRSRIQRIRIEKKTVSIAAGIAVLLSAGAIYGFYGLTQHVAHLQTAFENRRLREENERQRQELEKLNNRVEKVEDTSRKLAEKSGVVTDSSGGAGGPEFPIDEDSLEALVAKMNRLENELQIHEALLRQHGYTPSLWPVSGTLEGGFGGRRNPFGGGGYEFHSGQDIEAPWGAPVVAGATGKVSFVGWQNGYGQLVVIDHGGGLTTRYAHLSRIDVSFSQNVKRGELIGRIGSTGRSTGPHLHYEVRINDQPVNPLQYLVVSQ